MIIVIRLYIKVIVHYPDISESPDKNSDTNPHSRRTVNDLDDTSDPPDENSDPAPHERTAHYPDVPDTSESPDGKEKDPIPQVSTDCDDPNPSETAAYGPLVQALLLLKKSVLWKMMKMM